MSGKITNEFFRRNDGIVLTASAAKKYFKNEDPIGQIFNVTRERIRQIEARALNKLREAASVERIDAPE